MRPVNHSAHSWMPRENPSHFILMDILMHSWNVQGLFFNKKNFELFPFFKVISSLEWQQKLFTCKQTGNKYFWFFLNPVVLFTLLQVTLHLLQRHVPSHLGTSYIEVIIQCRVWQTVETTGPPPSLTLSEIFILDVGIYLTGVKVKTHL